MDLYEDTFLNENVRLESFITWPIPDIVDPGDLARSGFYYLNNGSTVTCIYCDGKIKNWEPGDIPDRKHKRLFPDCPFVQNTITSRLQEYNDVDVHFDSEVRVNIRKPNNSDYVTLDSRLNTFLMWPKALAQTPEKMAEAGFFYLGFGDAVECFSCEICFKDWEPQDDPWKEHAKASPKCKHVLTMKDGLTDLNNNQDLANAQSSNGLETILKETSISTTANSTAGNSAKHSEKLIKELIICKICMVEEAVVVLLPCSHLVVCRKCAPMLKKCPICRSVIKETMRIFT